MERTSETSVRNSQAMASTSTFNSGEAIAKKGFQVSTFKIAYAGALAADIVQKTVFRYMCVESERQVEAVERRPSLTTTSGGRVQGRTKNKGSIDWVSALLAPDVPI